MASYLNLARRQAARATELVSKSSELVSTRGSSYYKQMMENNKQYVVGDASEEVIAKLGKQLFFTTAASAPRRYQHMLSEWNVVKQKWANRTELTLQEVGIGALFVGEVYAWFCVGEIVGRGRTLTGYKV